MSHLPIKYQKFAAYGSLTGEKPFKSLKEVIKRYLEEWKFSREIAED